MFTYEAGVLTATVDFPGGNYAITRQPDGSYQVAQVATDRLPAEMPPRPVGSVVDLPESDVPIDSGRLIDVMIVWTPSAESGGGGAAAMQSLAQASIDNANLTYLNSGIAQRLRLVHAQQVSYTERTSCPGGGTAFDCALDDITADGDGYMDNVHTLRNTHGVDLVSLFINSSAYCGLAWLPLPSSSTADTGFSVIGYNGCPVANKSFVHELGHNMGAHHDPYVAPGPGAYAYSHGIVNLASRWRDVMSYNNQCADTPPNTSCTRIQYMSNPKLTYGGATLGDSSVRNNTHTLNKTAKAVAAYRATATALHPVPQRFADVATNHPFHGQIEFFAQAGITSGCSAGLYCPNAPVTRGQMAVFLERTMKASNWPPPPATGLFTDVPPGTLFRDFIEALKNDGITSGCGPTTYCPNAAVTRGQMAVFVLRARCGSIYLPNMPGSQTFSDVPLSHAFVRFIQKLYSLGITSGCASNPLRYCPDQAVTRGEMAVFVERTYPLLTPTEVCTP
ncbi:MAG TPA: S-layer homology domain-containing protein [Thermoanaerobaculia bacterium]|nr:S-layer homology domain-containing protein [Thermoanaerobaculia bacterium]